MFNKSAKVSCPKCGHKLSHQLGGADRNRKCPSCGKSLTIDSTDVKKAVDKAKKDLERAVREIGRKLK